ncbi:hypothetical protein BKA70DRAFT_1569408 [Coprinopsis sp. MPI-PUGE-AT-0042]|nr:hypothetical protein BKA70DRAFT_1569408 [Coprinopsis sp. MPI-PUGE-AT-0042]
MSDYVNKFFPSLSRQIFSPSWLTKSRGSPHLSQGERRGFSEIGAMSSSGGGGGGAYDIGQPFDASDTSLEPPKVLLHCTPCFEGPEPDLPDSCPSPTPSLHLTPSLDAIGRFRSSSLSRNRNPGALLSPASGLGLDSTGQSRPPPSSSGCASPPALSAYAILSADGAGLGIFGLPTKEQSFISDTPVLRSDVGLAPNNDGGASLDSPHFPPIYPHESYPVSEAAPNPFDDDATVPEAYDKLLSLDDDSLYGRPLSSIPECDSWQEVGDALRLSTYSKSNGSLTRFSESSRCVSPGPGGSSSASSCFRSSIHSSDCGHDSIFSNLDSDCSSRYDDPFCGSRTADLRRFSSASSLYPPHSYEGGKHRAQRHLAARDLDLEEERVEGKGSGGWHETDLGAENPFDAEDDAVMYNS